MDDNGTIIDVESVEPKLVWKWGEPNGRLVEQCGVIKTHNQTIMEDNSCGRWQYTTCLLNTKFFVQLQNNDILARDEIAVIDKEFVPLFGLRNPDDFLLKGFSNHVIVRNDSFWYLKDIEGNIILSIKVAVYSALPKWGKMSLLLAYHFY